MISPAWSAVTIAVLSVVATAPKRPSASRSAFVIWRPATTRPSWRPTCAVTSSRRASGVTASSEKHSMTAKISSSIGTGNANAPRSPPAAAASARGKFGSCGDVDDPGRAARRRDATREPDARRERHLLGQRPEGLVASRVLEVPQMRRERPRPRRRDRHARRASRSSGRRARRRRACASSMVSTLLVAAATFSIRATKPESVARGMEGCGIHPPDRRFVQRLEAAVKFP